MHQATTTPGYDEHYAPRRYLSISALVAFARCPRSYFYNSGCGMRTEPHIALRFGEALHAAIPQALATGDIGNAMQLFAKVWKDGDEVADKKRNTQRAFLMLQDLVSHAGPGRAPFKILEPPEGCVKIDDSTSDYEIPFAIDIGLDVPLVGKIDSWAQDRDDPEGFWPLEYKTTSSTPTTLAANFEINPQTIGYSMVMSTLTNKKIKGTYLIPLQSAVRKTETYLQPVHVSKLHHKWFLEWAHWHGAMLLECEKKKHFPMDISACTPYAQFGMPGFTCDYQMACQSDDWRDVSDFYQMTTPQQFGKEGAK